MVYEVRTYEKVGVFSTKLKKYVVRWVRDKECTAICKNKKVLNKLLSKAMRLDRFYKENGRFKYSIRALKGGVKHGKK